MAQVNSPVHKLKCEGDFDADMPAPAEMQELTHQLISTKANFVFHWGTENVNFFLYAASVKPARVQKPCRFFSCEHFHSADFNYCFTFAPDKINHLTKKQKQ